MPETIVRLSHDERTARRKEIAEAVKGGLSARRAMEKFGVSLDLVKKSCREWGVKVPKGKPGNNAPRTLRILAMLLSGMKCAAVAKSLDITTSWVEQVRDEARALGIKVP